MTHSYNLLESPWIPCLRPGGEIAELSISGALLEAETVTRIACPSPLETASVKRILMAILHRVFGPRDEMEWLRLWRAGRFEPPPLRDYFSRWRGRFDIFDPDRPFYQTPEMPIRSATQEDGFMTYSLVKHTLAGGSSQTLFDHLQDADPVVLGPAQTARLLLVLQCFFQGGLVSRLRGESPATDSAPLAKGAAVFYEGSNLFATLMCNLIPYDPEADQPFAEQSPDDRPAWEQDPVREPEKRRPLGYLDHLTWQSLRLRVLPVGAGSEGTPPGVLRFVLAGGLSMGSPAYPEPLFAYKINRKAKGEPWLPVRFTAERSLWRDATALLAATTQPSGRDADERAPLASSWLARLASRGYLDSSVRLQLRAFGVCSDQARVDFWREEQLAADIAYLSERGFTDLLRDALRLAEKVGGFLWACLQPELGSDGKPLKEGEVPASAVRDAQARYWSRLEYPFTILLDDIPTRPDQAVDQWSESVRTAARAGFTHGTRPLGDSARVLRLVTKARTRLERMLGSTAGPREEVAHG